MKKFQGVAIIGLLIWSWSAAAKDAECVKDGNKYGVVEGAFRSEWWNYQERGMSYIDGGCYEPALSDLDQAIKGRTQMVKQDCDQRRARTYGMHFVDYFGHRERGVALYNLGRMDEAQKELEFSLSCVESNQAQYYLDLIRKNKIESGKLDSAPPSVTISEPLNKSYTNQDELVLKGKATDDTLVKEVWVGNDAIVIPQAVKEISFESKLSLSPGWNNFKVRAIDITGKEKSADWSVYLDQGGPEVSISEIKPLASGDVEVTGSVNDEAPVSKLYFNNKEVALEGGKSFDVKLTVAPEYKIFFKVSDSAGNQTEGVVNLNAGPKGAMRERPERYMEASLMGDWQAYPSVPWQSYNLPMSMQMQRLGRADAEVAFTELYWNLKEKYDTSTDKEPPVIQLRSFKNETTVYFPELYLEGLVSDATGLKDVTINNKSVLKAQTKNMFFNQIVPLSEGINRIVIRATDLNGNVAERPIRVVRVVPQVHQMGERMVVSMLPFYQMGQVKDIGAVAFDNLISAIINQKRFSFVDRSKIDAIVRELKLSASQLVDPEYTLKVGKMTSAEGMIIGYVKEAPASIEVYAQLVDVESGTILSEKDAFDQNKSLDSLKFLTRGLAIRLREDFPVLEGKVTGTDGKKIEMNLGSGQKIKPGMRVIFFTEEQIKDPDSGVSLGITTNKLGVGKVTEVRGNMSLAEPIGKAEQISADKRVITK